MGFSIWAFVVFVYVWVLSFLQIQIWDFINGEINTMHFVRPNTLSNLEVTQIGKIQFGNFIFKIQINICNVFKVFKRIFGVFTK